MQQRIRLTLVAALFGAACSSVPSHTGGTGGAEEETGGATGTTGGKSGSTGGKTLHERFNLRELRRRDGVGKIEGLPVATVDDRDQFACLSRVAE